MLLNPLPVCNSRKKNEKTKLGLQVSVQFGPGRPFHGKTQEIPASIRYMIHGSQLKNERFKVWDSGCVPGRIKSLLHHLLGEGLNVRRGMDPLFNGRRKRSFQQAIDQKQAQVESAFDA